MLMALIELCLLSLVTAQAPDSNAQPANGLAPAAASASAQDPAPTQALPAARPNPEQPNTPPATALQATAPPSPAQQQDPHQQDPRVALHAAEQQGDLADALLLSELAMAADAQVAARAAWLLGKCSTAEHREKLAVIVTNSPHPEARLQALQAIRVQADARSTQLAISALGDDDRRVRTVAVQLLGKLRRPAAVEPLLELISTSCKLESAEPASDVQAALLTLTDLEASQHLLRMSTAINDGNAVGTGTALAYGFQTLSPKLPTEAETTVLIAVLDHKETMLRRYAITRLTELDSKNALTALEGRLGKEGNELRPLIEVAIAQIRHAGKEPPKDELERARENAKALWARTTIWWHGLMPTQQAMVGSAPAVLLVLLWLMRRAARRRHHDEDAQLAAELVQPSDEYLEQQNEEYEDADYEDADYEDGVYDDEASYEDGEFEEGFEEDDAEQGEFDTSGWDDDDNATVPADGNPEDELFR